MLAEFAPRFWKRFVRGESCWLWTGSHTAEGYSLLSVANGDTHHGQTKRVYAHRFAFELLRGPITPGLTLDHLCRNTGCVNPQHLEEVPIRVNILRGNSPSAKAARRTVCPRGHEYTHRSPDGHRRCRDCERLRADAIRKRGGA